ncbi:MAG: iron ABC transporter permease [Chloroflexi bacterium]|nr:iron ABC transporter permease [Chloroflexota bacterium]
MDATLSGRISSRARLGSVVTGPPALRRRWPPAFIWVPALAVALAMLLPTVYLLIRTADAGAALWPLLLRARTADLMVRSAGLAVAVTVSTVGIALPLAWLTVRTDLPGRRVWTVLTTLPLVIPTYVGAFAFVAALGPKGLLQQALAAPFGVDRLPEIYGFAGAWLALTFFTYPYVLLIVRAALRGLDPALEEASRSLGRGSWPTFWHVTLPQLVPAMIAGGLLVALYTLSDFGVVSLLQFDTFTRAIYTQYRASFDRTLAAGFALLLVGLTALILLLEARCRGRARYHRSTVGAVRPPRLLRLGRWTVPALVFVGAVVCFGLVLPLGVLVIWLFRGVGLGPSLQPVWQAAVNSVSASGLAAVSAVLAALPVAVLAVRYPGRLASLIERGAYVGFALPGIVIALALVFVATRLATPLYQTLALLIVAYVVRFLPQAVGSARSSLLQVNPRLEEAARALGRSPANVIVSVTVPIVWPGLLAGAALVFLTTMKELPATLLLSPIGFRTLATAIWTGASEGFFAEAAIAAVLLIAVSSVSLVFLSSSSSKRGGLAGG